MEESFVQRRIAQLLNDTKFSARDLSLQMGHSTSYIQSIISGRALPSMREFLGLCEYLGVTPQEFFNEERQTTALQQKAIDSIYALSEEDLALFLQLLSRLKD